MNIFQKYEIPVFLLLFALIAWMGTSNHIKDYVFHGDDLRYVQYAVALHEHGVFGLPAPNEGIETPPEHGNANAPLYPLFIASMMALDPALAQSLICVRDKGHKAVCPQAFRSLFMAQTGLALVCLFLIYFISLRLTQKRCIAWLAAGMAAGSGILGISSSVFMTEILILPSFCTLLLFCLFYAQNPRLRWVFAMAGMLAFLTLIRPSFLYLFYGFVLFFICTILPKPSRSSLFRLTVLGITFIMCVSPWAIRNKLYFNSFALTTGGYAEAILVERTNYNQMSWAEVGVAFIYWLPDFGDSLARKLFPEHLYNRLGWDDDSYYGEKYKRVALLTDQLGGHDKIVGHLIKEEILTPKHIILSIPLALRGMWIGKYWGLVGFIALTTLLIQTIRRKEYTLLVISLPVLFMVAFHAGLSVNVPRYNLSLILLYALSMAWYINAYGQKLVARLRHT